MADQPKILAFSGSARKGSYNKLLLTAAARAAEVAGAKVTVIDLTDYPMPLYNGDLEDAEGLPENAKKLKKLFIEHQGLLIASPEYNSSFSALLKNTIDWVSRAETDDEPSLAAYQNKLAGIMAASPGALGGLRGLVPLRMLLENINVMVIPKQVAVGKAYEAFNEDGTLKDKHHQAAIESLASDLVQKLQLLNANAPTSISV